MLLVDHLLRRGSRERGCDAEPVEVDSVHCLLRLEHKAYIVSVSLSTDGQHAVSGREDGRVALWFLNWELEENELADWEEGARPDFDVFLRAHQPYGATLSQDPQPTDDEVTRALTHQRWPKWSEDDFKGLLYTLGCAGYDWLHPEGVRRELERMTREWKDPQ